MFFNLLNIKHIGNVAGLQSMITCFKIRDMLTVPILIHCISSLGIKKSLNSHMHTNVQIEKTTCDKLFHSFVHLLI